MSFKGSKRGVLLVLLWCFLLGGASAQIGEPPTQLIRALELEEVAFGGGGGERYELGSVTLDFSLKGAQGALYRVTGGGVLDDAGIAHLAQVVGAATGYDEGIEGPLSEFLAARTDELAAQGEVSLSVEEFSLRLTVTPNPVMIAGPNAFRFALELPEVSADSFPEVRHALGPEGAKIVIREFSDFQCPFCARYGLEVLPQLKEELLARGDVRFEFHHLPLPSLHANAIPAAEAAECVTDANAGDPGAFWRYHDALLKRQAAWSGLGDVHPYFVRLAREIGLEDAELEACLAEGRYTNTVNEAYTLATQGLGLNSTPTVFVGGYRLTAADASRLEGYERAISRLEAFRE